MTIVQINNGAFIPPRTTWYFATHAYAFDVSYTYLFCVLVQIVIGAVRLRLVFTLRKDYEHLCDCDSIFTWTVIKTTTYFFFIVFFVFFFCCWCIDAYNTILHRPLIFLSLPLLRLLRTFFCSHRRSKLSNILLLKRLPLYICFRCLCVWGIRYRVHYMLCLIRWYSAYHALIAVWRLYW